MPPSTKTFCFLRNTQRNMTSFLNVHLVVKELLPISGVNCSIEQSEPSAALATRCLITGGPRNLPSAEQISAKINGHGTNRQNIDQEVNSNEFEAMLCGNFTKQRKKRITASSTKQLHQTALLSPAQLCWQGASTWWS